MMEAYWFVPIRLSFRPHSIDAFLSVEDKLGTALATSAHMIPRQMTDSYQHDAHPAGCETIRPFWDRVLAGLAARGRVLFRLPPAVWSRIVLVFLALAFIKLAMLIGS